MGRVVTYCNDFPRMCFCQILLESGERIFISVASGEGTAVMQMDDQGLTLKATLWQTSDLPTSGEVLDRLCDRLIDCGAIQYVVSAISASATPGDQAARPSAKLHLRGISVGLWSFGAAAAAWYFVGPMAALVAFFVMFSMCQVGAPRD